MMRFSLLLRMCLLPLVVSESSAAVSGPTVGIYDLDDQRLSGNTWVVSNEAGFSDLTLLVTIDTAGNVVSASAEDNFQKLDATPALALVRTWRFRPQTFDGHPVNAIGRVRVEYRMRPFPPDPSKPFPNGPLADSAITLERGACYGSCPDYRVTIHGDGLVEFDTRDDHFAGTAAQVHLDYNGHNVLLPGRHSAHIDPAKFTELLDRFRAAHFFGLKAEYEASVTDNPTQKLTVRVGAISKSVVDYVGTMAGMPSEVRELEDAVDKAADTARWVDGNAQTLADLDSSHFDFGSRDGERLALAAAAKLNDYQPSPGLESLILGLIQRGVPLNGPANVGATLVSVAAMQGKEVVFTDLADKGALAQMPRSSLSKAFANVGCSAKIARALVIAGADPHFADEDGTGLTKLRGSGSTCEDQPERRIELARALISLDVPLEARDNLGWTALMGCDSPELARLLLASGADAKVSAKDGTTAVLATDDDRVALILLRAGADPRAHNDQGTVRSTAVKSHWPATLAWLDAHGIR
jgi:hypothetical protein